MYGRGVYRAGSGWCHLLLKDNTECELKKGWGQVGKGIIITLIHSFSCEVAELLLVCCTLSLSHKGENTEGDNCNAKQCVLYHDNADGGLGGKKNQTYVWLISLSTNDIFKYL